MKQNIILILVFDIIPINNMCLICNAEIGLHCASIYNKYGKKHLKVHAMLNSRLKETNDFSFKLKFCYSLECYTIVEVYNKD